MRTFVILVGIVMLSFCTGGKDELPASRDNQAEMTSSNENEHAHEGGQHEDLHVTLEKQKAWGIEVQPPLKQSITSQVTLPGVLTLNQNKTAHISSFISGQISSITADLGENVKSRQILLVINSPQFAQAQADFLRSRAEYNLSLKDYQRAKRLYQEKAIEEKEYLRREAEHEKLTTEYGASGSKLHSYGMTHAQIDELIQKCQAVEDEEYKCEIADPHLPILSPLTGTIIFRDAILGEHIQPEKVLFAISDLKKLWAILDVYEQDIPLVKEDSSIHIHSPLYPEKHFTGKISYISDLIDEKLRTLKVRVEVDNAQNLLKPNMYIHGILANPAVQEEVLAVPEEAIQNLEGEKVVFLQEEESVFSAAIVQIGRKVGEHRIITAGLEANDRVVVKGAFSLKAELSKAKFGQAHAH